MSIINRQGIVGAKGVDEVTQGSPQDKRIKAAKAECWGRAQTRERSRWHTWMRSVEGHCQRGKAGAREDFETSEW